MAPWPVQSAPLKPSDNNDEKRACNGPRCSMKDKNNRMKTDNSGGSSKEKSLAVSNHFLFDLELNVHCRCFRKHVFVLQHKFLTYINFF